MNTYPSYNVLNVRSVFARMSRGSAPAHYTLTGTCISGLWYHVIQLQVLARHQQMQNRAVTWHTFSLADFEDHNFLCTGGTETSYSEQWVEQLLSIKREQEKKNKSKKVRSISFQS